VSTSVNGSGRPAGRPIAEAVAARQRARMVAGLRGLAKPPAPASASAGPPPAGGPGGVAIELELASAGTLAGEERCELCGLSIDPDHRHLLALVERRIVCACEACWAMRSGEGDYRPVGNRTLWLSDVRIPDELWASLQIPIGLAFLMHSTVTECVVAMYPSPAGATESELRFESWARMVALNPVLAALEPDVEGLIVNRLVEPPIYAIAPIDRCYALTGAVKLAWEGISGGAGVERAVSSYFEQLREQAVPA
jgi:Family of unknown function (DUF5947)